MSERTFKKGQVLFRQGDASDVAYLIESGEVEVLDQSFGREIRVAVLGKGQIVGEMGLVDERPRSLTARAASEVSVTAVTREDFVDLILHDPAKGLHYLRELFERLRAMNIRALASGQDLAADASSPPLFDVTLLPLTDQAAAALPAGGLQVLRSPYRVGRALGPGEANLDSNDLLLADDQPYHLSRNHFSIEIRVNGVFVHDRGSRLGTIVNDTHIGGHHHGNSALLVVGDNEVSAGSRNSPFRFRVLVRPAG